MGKGYADGPAAEALHEAQERGGDPAVRPAAVRRMVWGSTPERPEPHPIGPADEVDADELFRTGRAWGIRIAVETVA